MLDNNNRMVGQMQKLMERLIIGMTKDKETNKRSNGEGGEEQAFLEDDLVKRTKQRLRFAAKS